MKQTMKRCIYAALSAVFAILLLFVIFVTSFEAVCYWMPGLYHHEFEKYQVLETMKTWKGDEMTMEDLDKVMEQTMIYLRGDRENLIVETTINGDPAEFYNANEKSHMADVRVLFVRCLTLRALAILTLLAIAALLIVLAHGQALRILGRGYLVTCAVILTLVIILGLLAMTDFTKYFTIFHEIFFSQGNWLFDPRESRMIDVMPEGFFYDIAARVFMVFLGAVAALLIPDIIFAFRSRSKRRD